MENQFSVAVHEVMTMGDFGAEDQSGISFAVIVTNHNLPQEMEKIWFAHKGNEAFRSRDRGLAEIIAARWARFLGAAEPEFIAFG